MYADTRRAFAPFRRKIAVDKLRALLATLPESAVELEPNNVGNLNILGADDTFAGYIDLSEETVELERKRGYGPHRAGFSSAAYREPNEARTATGD